jgi:hypothetical protein
MGNLPRPAHLKIRIDEWRVAQGTVEAVEISIAWREASKDPDLASLLAVLPEKHEFVPIELVDGRTELAPEKWKHIRFGKGLPIFESARSYFDEGWGKVWTERTELRNARQRVTDMIRRYVPDFDERSDEEQIDLIVRTQDKLNNIRDSVEDLILHLEYATPGGKKAYPPLRNPLENVQAAVFSDVMRSSKRAGELLGVPLPSSDAFRNENQTIRQRAKLGRELLHYYFGEAKWNTKVARVREYRRWWAWYESLDNKDGMYALLAKARKTSLEQEKRAAEEDGFDRKLGKWIALVEARLEIEETQERNKYNEDFAWPGAIESKRRRIQDKQFRIQESDERFAQAFSVFDAPPDDKP